MWSGEPFSIRDVLIIAISACLSSSSLQMYQLDVTVCSQRSACVGVDVLTGSLDSDQYALFFCTLMW